jgi:hypothetical protein
MALIQNSFVTIPFSGLLLSNPNINLMGTQFDIYVDGILQYSGIDVVKDSQYLTITFDASTLISKQKSLTFKSSQGIAVFAYVIKVGVNAPDDIVIAEYDPTVDPVPSLGTYSTYQPPTNSILQLGGGGSTTGQVTTTYNGQVILNSGGTGIMM